MLNVIFYGTPDFALLQLKELFKLNNVNIKCVITQPDKPAGRGKKIKMSSVKEFALENGLKIIQPISPKKELASILSTFDELGAIDIAIVVAYGHVLPKTLLDYPKSGSINIHASLLPRHRGAAPIQRAILEGDTVTGTCLMQMEAGLDTGPVFVEKKVEITEADNAETLHDKLAFESGKLLKENVFKIANGEIKATAQSDEGVTYAHKIDSKVTEINWNSSAKNILNKIRAFEPIPGAFCFFNKKRLKIFKAEITDIKNNNQAVGFYKELSKEELFFFSSDFALKIIELQIEGKKRMLASDFMKGFKAN